MTDSGVADGALTDERSRPALAVLWRPFRNWRKAGILLPLAALFIYLSVTVPPFLHQQNLTNILDQQAAVLCIAVAGTFVLVSGGIDLSVGSTYALAGVVAATVGAHHGAVLAIISGILVGLAVGVVNGIVVTIFRVNPFVTTLAMSYIVYGIALQVSSDNLLLTTNIPGFSSFANTFWWKFQTAVWIAVAFAIALSLLLSRTTFGRAIVASGGNATAARLAGVRVNLVRIAAFSLSGTAAGLGGVLDASRLGSVEASSGGVTLAFMVLAAIVVGGTSIAGGDGSGWRTIAGVFFIALIGNGFDLKGFNPNWQPVVLGIILIAAVGVDSFTRRAQR